MERTATIFKLGSSGNVWREVREARTARLRIAFLTSVASICARFYF